MLPRTMTRAAHQADHRASSPRPCVNSEVGFAQIDPRGRRDRAPQKRGSKDGETPCTCDEGERDAPDRERRKD